MPARAFAHNNPGEVFASIVVIVSHMEKKTTDSRVALSGITPFDLFLILLLLMLSTGLIVRSGFSSTQREASDKTAVIHCSGEVINRIDLGKNTTFDLLGGRMKLVSKDGQIRIAHSDCPGNTCVHAGWIKSAGETLVCVPNQVVVEIITDEDPVVDAVVF